MRAAVGKKDDYSDGGRYPVSLVGASAAASAAAVPAATWRISSAVSETGLGRAFSFNSFRTLDMADCLSDRVEGCYQGSGLGLNRQQRQRWTASGRTLMLDGSQRDGLGLSRYGLLQFFCITRPRALSDETQCCDSSYRGYGLCSDPRLGGNITKIASAHESNLGISQFTRHSVG